MTEQQQSPKVAIYWDFENIHLSLLEGGVPPYKPHPAIVDVAAVMDYASSVGSVCVNRAYCNWTRYGSYGDALSGHGVELMQLFPRGPGGKNGADIQMCVDAVEDLIRRPYVDVYIIVSGDSDFVGAVQKLRQYGKRVIGIGVRGSSNRFFQRVCDEFKFYDTLIQEEEELPVAADEAGVTEMGQARNLLVAAMRRLALQYGDPAVLKARVKPMMQRLESTFDERGLGFSSFADFIAACSDLIDENTTEADHTLRLRGGDAGEFAGGPNPEVLDSMKKLLVAATSFLLQKGGETVPMASVKPMLLKLDPAFHESRVNARGLQDFLYRFPEVVSVIGEGTNKFVKLLVAPDTGGYVPPPSPPKAAQAASLPDPLPTEETLRATANFLIEDLRRLPATDWPQYHERLRAALDAAGDTADEATRKSAQGLFWGARIFHRLPDHGGITILEDFADGEAVLARVLHHLAELTAASLTEHDGLGGGEATEQAPVNDVEDVVQPAV